VPEESVTEPAASGEEALASLTSLDINLSELTEDGLHTLGELPALLTLTLWLEKGEYMIAVQGTGFPSLKIIEIYNCKGTYIKFVKGAMPKLEALILELSLSVGRNPGFQLGIVQLPSLKMVVAYFRKEEATSFEEKRAAAVHAIMKEQKAHKSHPKVYFSTREYEDKGYIDEETMMAVQRDMLAN
jgi:disease resistance protein RPM1